MELTEQELARLAEDQELLELTDSPVWQKFRKVKLEDAIARIENTLATVKCQDWDAYLSLWYRREAIMAVLGEFESMKRDIKTLTEKAAQEPDNSPATGELA